jgi:hypothetical protein
MCLAEPPTTQIAKVPVVASYRSRDVAQFGFRQRLEGEQL